MNIFNINHHTASCRVSFVGILFATTSMIAITSPSYAQDNASQATSSIEEITVTARKRAESITDVPISISAFSAETLELSKTQSLADISSLTPGLTYTDFGDGANGSPVIRGVAQTNPQVAERNVSIFIDGIYIADSNAINVDLLDMERVEVIKGPQSALYGRNSFGGAINYVTRMPGDEMRVNVSTSAGSDEYFELKGNISGPIIDDLLSGRLSGAFTTFDGTIENPADRSDNLQGYETVSLGGSLNFEPSDTLEIIGSAYYTDRDADGSARFVAPFNCGASAPGFPGFGGPSYFCGELPTQDEVEMSPGTRGLSENFILSAAINWDINNAFSLKSLTGKVDSSYDGYTDFDFSADGEFLLAGTSVAFSFPFPVTANPRPVLSNTFFGTISDTEDFTQEIRLEYDNGGAFSGLIGAFYYDHETRTIQNAGVDTANLLPGEIFGGFGFAFGTADPVNDPVLSNDTIDETNSWSAFARGEYEFTPSLTGSAEIRYTDEEKDVTRLASFGLVFPNPATESAQYDFVTARGILDYKLNEDVLLYSSIARGARAGGFNTRPGTPEETSYGPEFNTAYELGTKITFSDRKYGLNAAVYHIDWSDVQVPGISEDPFNIFSVVRNQGNATINGTEIEFYGQPTDTFDFNLGYAYADPTFDDNTIDRSVSSQCGVDSSICSFDNLGFPDAGGSQIIRTSKHQFNASATLETGKPVISNYEGYVRGDLSYQSKQFVRSINTASFGERTLMNARLGLKNETFDFAIWAKNLFDESYASSATIQPRFSGATTLDVLQGDGRIIGATARASF